MELSKYIDHTLLKPEATKEQIIALCEEAKEYNFASVCVNSCYVPLCAEILKDSDIKVCSVIGFPLGQMSAKSKVFEALNAVSNGAEEIDMVINIGMLKSGNLDYVENEIRAIKKEIGRKRILKVIIETCLLTDEEKIAACRCAMKAGADFVKTSTGFSKGGATIEDVRLMKTTVGDFCLVKAAGGIRTKEDMLAMIEAGASRIGTSSGPKLL